MSQKRRIVMIEDNEQNRYLITYLLSHHGYEVVALPDGQSGLEWLERNEPPALVLLDIQLPGMDGYEVARAIRRKAELATLPIIAVSSFAMPNDRDKALQAGCDDYIEKPIDPDSFPQRVSSLLASA